MQIKDLPIPVQRYLKYSLRENQSYISYVRLQHGGEFRASKSWVSIKGEEYFTVQKPGFVWSGKVPLFSAKDIYFNEEGQITQFKTKRYKDKTLENFTGYCDHYRSVDGIKVPFYLEATWNLESGDWSYAKFKIKKIEYNNPSKFE